MLLESSSKSHRQIGTTAHQKTGFRKAFLPDCDLEPVGSAKQYPSQTSGRHGVGRLSFKQMSCGWYRASRSPLMPQGRFRTRCELIRLLKGTLCILAPPRSQEPDAPHAALRGVRNSEDSTNRSEWGKTVSVQNIVQRIAWSMLHTIA